MPSRDKALTRGQLEARLRLIEARLNDRNRKRENRRVFLAGRAALSLAQRDAAWEAALEQELDELLHCQADRTLFGLRSSR